VSTWQRFWFAGIPPHIYALLRITIGVAGVWSLLGLTDLVTFWDLQGLVSRDGLVALKAWAAAHGAGSTVGRALFAACLASLLAMTVGFRSALSVPLSLVSLLLEGAWNYLPLSGAHEAMQGFLFCLMWADTGAVWSVDSWLEHRRTPIGERVFRPVSVAPLRLIRYQVALIYLASGLWKLYNPLWREGLAVHFVLHNNVFHRFPNVLPVNLEWLATVATYATLGWELGFAFLLLYRPTRRLALIAGVLIHLGMLVLLEIGPFHVVMLAAYPAFLDPASVGAFSARLGMGAGRPNVGPAGAPLLQPLARDERAAR
jgi:hypothetical protein